jgi:hypothetical protein
MLFYLDANIVQDCADYDDFLFGSGSLPSGINAKLKGELCALRKLVEIELQLEDEDFENRWDFAASRNLMKELLSGRPTENQRNVYSILRQVWNDFGQEYPDPDTEQVAPIYHSLHYLNLKGSADRLHLAQAIAIGAAWFLTRDDDILKKTRPEPAKWGGIGFIQGVRVALPSECVQHMSLPAWKLIQKYQQRVPLHTIEDEDTLWLFPDMSKS